jgi:hypothetical protein
MWHILAGWGDGTVGDDVGREGRPWWLVDKMVDNVVILR